MIYVTTDLQTVIHLIQQITVRADPFLLNEV